MAVAVVCALSVVGVDVVDNAGAFRSVVTMDESIERWEYPAATKKKRKTMDGGDEKRKENIIVIVTAIINGVDENERAVLHARG